jgi:hypothetical protein
MKKVVSYEKLITDAERDRQRSDRRDLCRGLYARQYGDLY